MFRFLVVAADANTDLTNVLSMATQLSNWFISTMVSIIGFIVDNPIVLVYFLAGLFFTAIGGLMALWHHT